MSPSSVRTWSKSYEDVQSKVQTIRGQRDNFGLPPHDREDEDQQPLFFMAKRFYTEKQLDSNFVIIDNINNKDPLCFNSFYTYYMRKMEEQMERYLNQWGGEWNWITDLNRELFDSNDSGSSIDNFKGLDEESLWACDPEHSHGTGKKRQVKSSARHRGKSHVKKMKRKFRRESFSEDSDGCETFFQATFGKRWYTWYFNESSYRGSTFGFDWREHPYWTNHRDKDWDARSETESVNESCSVGSFHDRTILGLPPSGPLRIEDVKDAFRMSALKWHPDKHQGPSQAMAEEKFKLCVNAYKSLCDALSSV
ncbi:hypothetical protein GH714_020534 [Hevea brasiliensis]|uniref:J domain-containing protein n=1 Tax=Hevea brasiliensis TaxID=3981 RepID=A0A6A6K8G3_HEVBR|nr:hypothetical protein GH714_020534 [Hevea brasiliensis]